jgi:hypothetical protein
MLRLALGGEVLWRNAAIIHHDFEIREDGHIYTLCNHRGVYDFYPSPVVEEFVLELDENGREVRRVSIVQSLLNSPAYRNLLDIIDLAIPPRDSGMCDIFHTNSLQVLEVEGRDDVFVLLSIRNLSLVALLDMEREEIVWAMTGLWRKQHEARLQPSGTVMLFDNLGHEGRSKVIEFDPGTQDIVWQYDDPEFFSIGAGSQQVLPNGNVLITESRAGRIFEVTRKGRIVWEYITPETTDDGLVVEVPRAERIGR